MTSAAPPTTASSRVPEVPEDGGGPGLPVVQMQHVDRTPVGPQRLERGPAVQPEPPGVVRIVPGGVAVEALTIECRRIVHEPQAVPVRGHVHDGHGRRAGPRPRVRNGQRRLAQDGGRFRVRNAAIARQEHVDRTVDAVDLRVTQCPRQRIHHVRQATGLRPRLTLGGQERHAQSHRVHGSPRPGRRKVGRCRSTKPVHMVPANRYHARA